jgi:hypothetical protein
MAGKAGMVRSLVSRYLKSLPTTVISSMRGVTFGEIAKITHLENFIAYTGLRSVPAFSFTRAAKV